MCMTSLFFSGQGVRALFPQGTRVCADFWTKCQIKVLLSSSSVDYLLKGLQDCSNKKVDEMRTVRITPQKCVIMATIKITHVFTQCYKNLLFAVQKHLHCHRPFLHPYDLRACFLSLLYSKPESPMMSGMSLSSILRATSTWWCESRSCRGGMSVKPTLGSPKQQQRMFVNLAVIWAHG